MKKILILSLFILAGFTAFAQQKPKTDYMIITVTDGVDFDMFVSRTDSAQMQQHIKMNLKDVQLKGYEIARDSVMLSALKTYADRGWKLISTSVQTNKVSRYYLSKKQ